VPDGLKLLTADWFLNKATVGVATGYSLRVVEHLLWVVKTRDQSRSQAFLFALLILPQSIVFGVALGYVILVGIAYRVSNETVLSISAYSVSALMAFIATDLRELVRRISRW
jgi:hypothetical protein